MPSCLAHDARGKRGVGQLDRVDEWMSGFHTSAGTRSGFTVSHTKPQRRPQVHSATAVPYAAISRNTRCLELQWLVQLQPSHGYCPRLARSPPHLGSRRRRRRRSSSSSSSSVALPLAFDAMQLDASLLGSWVSPSWVRVGEEAGRRRARRGGELLRTGSLPEEPWDEASVEALVDALAAMDANNYAGNVGAGEREGRVFAPLVRRRHFGLAHGMGPVSYTHLRAHET